MIEYSQFLLTVIAYQGDGMNNDFEIEVCGIWPRQRNPNVPFFVFNDAKKQCVVAGTFPDGKTCLTAIPANVKDKAWLYWTNLQQAEEAAKHLNRLHQKGSIDWSSIPPKIIEIETDVAASSMI